MLDDIVLFLKIVEYGSFRKAAQFSNISLPTISKRIANLEERLSNRLMDRDPKNIRLTDYGKFIYLKFENLLLFSNRVESLEKSSEINSHKHVETVTVNIGLAIGQALINKHIPQFLDNNPEISLNIVNKIGSNNKDAIGDIVISPNYIEKDGYITKIMCLMPYKLYCYRSYSVINKLPDHPDELLHHRCIGAISEEDLPIDIICISNDITNQKIMLDVNNLRLKASHPLALKDLGVSYNAIFPTWEFFCKDELLNGTILRVLPDWTIYTGQVVMCTKQNPTQNEKEVINFLYECLGYKDI